jgi:hypothetical protein
MPVGRCSSKLSGHELQAKSKKSQALSGRCLPAHAVQSFSTTELRRTESALLLPTNQVAFLFGPPALALSFPSDCGLNILVIFK